MKNFVFVWSVVASGLAAFFGVEWWQTRAQLKAEERVHQAEMSGERKQAAQPPPPDIAGGARSSLGNRNEVDLKAQLEAKDSELESLRKHLAVVSDALAHTQSLVAKALVQAIDDGTLVYGPGVKITLPNKMVVSSPTGIMVSDASQTHIDGDLEVEAPDGKMIKVTNGSISIENGHLSFTSAELFMPGH